MTIPSKRISWLQVALVGVICVGLSGCAGLGFGRRDRAKAPPAAETVQQAKPERRRGRIGIPRLGRSKRAPKEAAAPPARAEAKPAPPGQVVALAPEETTRRLVAFLKAKGYSMQQAADEAPTDVLVTDPLLTDATAIDHLADCGSAPSGKPILHSSVVEARITPEGTGSRVSLAANFAEIRQPAVGEGMSKVDCKSLGVFEAEVVAALAR